MKQEQIQQLARNILRNSIKLQPGEKVFLESTDINAMPLLEALIEETCRLGGIPFYYLNETSFTNAMLRGATKEQIAAHGEIHRQLMSQMDAWVGIRNFNNPFDERASGADKLSLYQQDYMRPVHFETRIKLRWCLLRYPNAVWAYQAGMSTKAFEDYYFTSCLADYTKMEKAIRPLFELMQKTDRVVITAKDTHLGFSIKNIPVVSCHGVRNLPDGEVYSAPVLGSVNGYIRFNTPAIEEGNTFSNIKLYFKDGEIYSTESDTNNEALQEIILRDKGCRCLGEFALGINPYITTPVGNTLFDEKITGSLHLAIGNEARDGLNGNKAPIHWDLVLMQTPEYGGGEVWFDKVLIRKDGRFVLKELEGLNPENLK